MFFLKEEFSLLICSFTQSWMKRVVLLIYCSVIAPATRWHNSVLEMGHLSLVDLRSVEEWDRAFLRVYDLWAMRNEMVSFLKMLVIL